MSKYLRITPNYILKNKKASIKKYKKTYKTDVHIGVVPNDVDLCKLEKILSTMIHTGYTFIASYYIISESECKDVISINDIEVLPFFSKPGSRKLQSKKKDLVEKGYINPVILNSKHQLLDGYATLLMLQQCGEKYIPYIIDDNYICNKSRHSSIDDKIALYMKQGGICYICGRHTYMDAEHKGTDLYATVDHVVPLSKGGSNDISNMAIACTTCNNLKASFRYSEALREVITSELKERGLL